HMIWQFEELGADESTKSSDGGNNTSPKKVVWNYLNNVNRKGLMETYKMLFHLRTDNPAFFVEGIPTTTIACNSTNWNSGYYTSLKTADGLALYLVVNPTTSQRTVALGGTTTADGLKLVGASYNTTPTIEGTRVTLPAGSFAIYGSDKVMGVEDVTSDTITSAKVLGGNGNIVVAGAYKNIQVYDMMGKTIGRTENLTPGVYVVVVDGNTSKVLVR
ncbi:MAG: hypothetical protein K2N91_00410, partial [Muribaculaceae bacterium]|nr:hypothetical protein [Muribaculaceae bacterium]